MKNKPIPTVGPLGVLSECFLECGRDGVVRIKDGRSLEEYINDPRIVARRKNTADVTQAPGPTPMVLCTEDAYLMGALPRGA